MKPVIAITIGDPAGIGPEIVVRALAHEAIYQNARPIVIGDRTALDDAVKHCELPLGIVTLEDINQIKGAYGKVELLDLTHLHSDDLTYGRVSARCGDASFRYVEEGIKLAIAGKVDAIATGPINKEALHLAGHQFSGHTEIFAQKTGCTNYAMVLCSDVLRVIHISTHVPMLEACRRVTEERVTSVIELAQQTLLELGVLHPRIAVAGLNAHASENGLFGHEELEQIVPAIDKMRKKGVTVEGPIPPDTVFVKAVAGVYDIVVAMYHDQGHIPVKLSGFHLDPETGRFNNVNGVNFTAGLPIVRTSVDHGTAFDRAGRWCSNEQSMVEAINMAVKLVLNRRGSHKA